MSEVFTSENNVEVEYGSLKTLTVLTFIGSGLQFFSSIWQFFQADKGVEALEKVANDPSMMEKIPDFLKKAYSPEAIEAARVAAANKLPIFILSIIGVVLCTVGAIQMRKLRQQGYYLWLIGEIFPLIGMILFLGKAAFAQSPLMLAFGYGILALFVILYTLQRKYLINK